MANILKAIISFCDFKRINYLSLFECRLNLDEGNKDLCSKVALLTRWGALDDGGCEVEQLNSSWGAGGADVTHFSLRTRLAFRICAESELTLHAANVLFPPQIFHVLFAVGRDFLGFLIKGK